MNNKEKFYETVKKAETMVLATSKDNNVTMRVISPVYCEGKILFFTNQGSKKYEQLKANKHCCISTNYFFAEVEAEFLGSTMSKENERYRQIYSEKFAGAFDEINSFNGTQAEFILLKPIKLSGWTYNYDISSEIPTIPFKEEF